MLWYLCTVCIKNSSIALVTLISHSPCREPEDLMFRIEAVMQIELGISPINRIRYGPTSCITLSCKHKMTRLTRGKWNGSVNNEKSSSKSNNSTTWIRNQRVSRSASSVDLNRVAHLKFAAETPGLCCIGDKVKLPPLPSHQSHGILWFVVKHQNHIIFYRTLRKITDTFKWIHLEQA